MKHLIPFTITILFIITSTSAQQADQSGVDHKGKLPLNPIFDELVWSDEFETDGAVDTGKWFHQTQLPAGGSWYNGEIQHYINRMVNAYIDNGVLKIVAKKETYTDQGYTKQYTSARLNAKFAFTYGKVEVRAKLPSGAGTWPAIWMLGKNIDEDGAYWDNQGFGTTPWPACGEIDIMEEWGSNPTYVQSAVHTPSSYGSTINLGGRTLTDASTAFHTYAMEWTQEKLVFSVDDVVHYTYDPPVKDASTWPFEAEQYLLLNVAILPDIDPEFTQSAMEIDYVRVYQESSSAVPDLAEEHPVCFPNPVRNTLNIIFNHVVEQELTLNVYNVVGQRTKTYSCPIIGNKITLNQMADLPAGIYLVNFDLDNRLYRLKFIKN